MIKAVLFDMDGVLVDSEELTYEAAIEMLRERGADACKEDFIPFIGAGDIAYLGGAAGRHGLSYDKSMSVVTYQKYEKLVAEHDIAYENTVKTVLKLKENGLKLAVCTSSDLVKMNINLRAIGLNGVFDALVNGRDIENNKPAPDIYLKGAGLLGVPADECLVVEDAKNGILAAKAAGMHNIALTTTFSREELIDSVDPEFICNDLYDIVNLICQYNTKHG
ncbi:MAG: HAD-IA family hydrolase [Clostridia bacterium]|nr:HAD-IA family hydrolase [Clostridia bacterium]